MTRLFRDPLIVFLLIGAGIFLLYTKLNPSDEIVEDNPNLIQVTNDIQNMLASEWRALWNRPPSPEEFKGLLDGHIKEEILFREASKLGLDQSDSIIRRRLAQKMEFLTSDIADFEEVSDETLQAFYQENSASYQQPAELAFQQLYFSTDKRADAAADSATLLAKLNDGSLSIEQAIEASDRTLLNPEYKSTSLPVIGKQFGTEFTEAIADQQPGDWLGPVKSGYGLHLVRITGRKEGHLPEFASVRTNVLNDYRYQQRKTLNENVLVALLEQYEVVIDTRVEEPAESDEK